MRGDLVTRTSAAAAHTHARNSRILRRQNIITFLGSLHIILMLCTPVGAELLMSPANLEQNPCTNKVNCHECIQTQNCGWCMKPDYGDKPRCFLHTPNKDVCPEEFQWMPGTSERILINKDLTLASGGVAWSAGGGQFIGQEGNAQRSSSASGSYSASSSSSSYGSSSMSGSSSSSGFSASSGSQSAYGSAAMGAAAAGGEIVQIKPQRVSLKLRISK